MVCTKVKGSGIKAASSPDQEPDFYALPPIGVVHGESECDMSSHGAPTTGINDNFDRLVARISAIPPGPTDEDDISVLDENIVDA